MLESPVKPTPPTSDPATPAPAGVAADGRRPAQIAEAIRLYQQEDPQASRDHLHRYLAEHPGQVEALIWLAKVTPDPQEAIAAANLASKLDPHNDVAQRAVTKVHQMYAQAGESELGENGLSLAIAIKTGMTLGQARSVIWPFRGINRPIGDALDDKRITFDDLVWAVDNAWDDRIRDAAKTILVTRMTGAEPKDRPRGPKVIRGSRFTEDRERAAAIGLGAIYGRLTTLIIGIVVVTMAMALLELFGVVKFPFWIWPLIVLSIGLFHFGLRPLQRRREEVDAYQAGRRGEEKAVEELTYHLDGRWTIFRNYAWADRSWGDVDLVLVGPRGIAAFEVKAYSFRTRNTGDRWEQKDKARWRELISAPGHQARRNASNVRNYLQRHGVNVNWVEAAVLWAGEPHLLSVHDPATPVWRIDEVGDRLDDLWTGKPLTDETVQQAVAVLHQALQTKDPTERGRDA